MPTLSCRNLARRNIRHPGRAVASPDSLGPWVPALGLTPSAGMTATMRDANAVMPESREAKYPAPRAGGGIAGQLGALGAGSRADALGRHDNGGGPRNRRSGGR